MQTEDFVVPADHRIKLKECEKKNKHQDVAWELKKSLENEGDSYNNGDFFSFCTATKGLLKGLEDLEIRGRDETIQTTAFLRADRILRRVLET